MTTKMSNRKAKFAQVFLKFCQKLLQNYRNDRNAANRAKHCTFEHYLLIFFFAIYKVFSVMLRFYFRITYALLSYIYIHIYISIHAYMYVYFHINIFAISNTFFLRTDCTIFPCPRCNYDSLQHRYIHMYMHLKTVIACRTTAIICLPFFICRKTLKIVQNFVIDFLCCVASFSTFNQYFSVLCNLYNVYCYLPSTHTQFFFCFSKYFLLFFFFNNFI